MMSRFSIVSVFVALVLVAGCGSSPQGRIAARLDDVESYIDAHPDSALAVLRALDADSLRGPSQYARAALLHQVALDKCYIDITSDSVLSPAFWYLKHGTADQKLKTWYYRSVLARNAGDIDTQMSCLIRAEQYIPKAENPLMSGFVYTAKRVVFLHVYDLDNARTNAEKAMKSFETARDRRRYFDAVISLANINNLLGRMSEAGQLIDTVKTHLGELSFRQRNKAFGVELKYRTLLDPSGEALLPFVEKYLMEVPSAQVDWTLAARTYWLAGEYDKAQKALSQVKRETLNEEVQLGGVMAKYDLCRSIGLDAETLALYDEYQLLSKERTERGLFSRARFAEEELLMTEQTRRTKWICVLISLVLLLICLSAVIWKRLKERQLAASLLQNQLKKTSHQVLSLRQQVRAAEREAGRWKELLQREQLSPEMTRLISERVSALNRYAFSLAMQKDRQQALSDLEASLSHDELQDLTLEFRFLHPSLNQFLGKYRLSDQEMVLCTLLAMGSRPKDIAMLAGLSSQRCYNVFAAIRQKMGLEGESRTLQTLLQAILTAEKD